MLGARIPHIVHRPTRRRPTRRHLLLGAGGLALVTAGLSGCTSSGGSPDARPDAPPEPDPDRGILGRARDSAAALLARYDATLRVHADTADRLGPLRDIHRRQLATLEIAATAARRGPVGADQLRPTEPTEPSESPGETPSDGGTAGEDEQPEETGPSKATESPQSPTVPESRSAALAALGRSERATVRSQRQRMARAESGQVARLFASLAAAGEQNAAYLEAGGDV